MNIIKEALLIKNAIEEAERKNFPNREPCGITLERACELALLESIQTELSGIHGAVGSVATALYEANGGY